MTEGPSFAAARIEDLTELLAFVDEECAGAGVSEDVAFALRLAAEEAFVNIVRHGYGGRRGPVRSGMEHGDDSITLTLMDEAPTFDPADAPPPDLESGLEERREGGLGWHLIRQLMDEVHHRSGSEGGNAYTLVKHLGGTHEN